MKKTKLLLMGCACALTICVSVRAQNPTAAAGTNKVAANAPKPATAPAQAAAPSKTDRNIRFQFDGIPYGDVLERFAQMANKPLVADTNIQGTLTFNDGQPYTYQEA